MSYYYWLKHLSKKTVSASGKVRFMRRSCRNYMFKYLKREDSSDTPQSLVGSALVGGVYGFIGLAERYDESMVMLSYLLRIPLSDVLYLKSKESANRAVRHPSMAEEDFAVRSYAASTDFNSSNALDYQLYAAANAELDRRWRSTQTLNDKP
jgi:hypothetical protein